MVEDCGYLEACGNPGLAESWGRCWDGSMHPYLHSSVGGLGSGV